MSGNIRAKFRCHVVEKYDGNEVVRLRAVNGKDGTDNATWSKFTPSGELSMTITADGAVGKFQPGKEYFLDFTPAE